MEQRQGELTVPDCLLVVAAAGYLVDTLVVAVGLPGASRLGTAMTDLPAVVPAEENFRIGQIFGRSFAILWRNAAVFVPLGAFAALPDLLQQLQQLRQVSYGVGPGIAVGSSRIDAGDIGLPVLSFLLGLCVQAVVVYAAFQDMRGSKVRLGTSVGIGLSRLLPVIGASIGVGVVTGVGVLLLIVPGLIAMAMLYVAVPVCVVEKLGPFKSLDRSAALTKGYRWKVFGIALLPVLVGAIVAAIIATALSPLAGPMAAALGQFSFEAIFNAFEAIVAVVTYHDLRVAKEGVDIERIAAVFD